MSKPLAIDLFCGLGGWTEGFLAEGYDVIGFDIERRPYPAQLVLQDVLTLHGSQFRNAAMIVASPPCQAYSYRAMPWKRAKALPPPDNSLFEACFRIAKEANLPIVVENVKGAQPWVGRAKAHFGSFYLWGDVESIGSAIVRSGRVEFGVPMLRAARRSMKMGRAPVAPNGVTRRLTNPAEWQECDTHEYGQKNDGGSWFNVAHNTESGVGNNPVGRKRPGVKISAGFNNWPKDENGAYVMPDGTKIGGDYFSGPQPPQSPRRQSSRSKARKEASAQIAKIPFELARHVAAIFKPD